MASLLYRRWQKVKSWIEFKISCLVHQSLSGRTRKCSKLIGILSDVQLIRNCGCQNLPSACDWRVLLRTDKTQHLHFRWHFLPPDPVCGTVCRQTYTTWDAIQFVQTATENSAVWTRDVHGNDGIGNANGNGTPVGILWAWDKNSIKRGNGKGNQPGWE